MIFSFAVIVQLLKVHELVCEDHVMYIPLNLQKFQSVNLLKWQSDIIPSHVLKIQKSTMLLKYIANIYTNLFYYNHFLVISGML